VNATGKVVFRKAPDAPKEQCPFLYWKGKLDVWPILSVLDSTFLSISPSSADVERLFSQAGLTMSCLRTRLEPERFHKLIKIKVEEDRDSTLRTGWVKRVKWLGMFAWAIPLE